MTAEQLPERLAALLQARGVDVRAEPNHVWVADGSLFRATWEVFKVALAEPVANAVWDVVTASDVVQGPYGSHGGEPDVQVLEFTRLVDGGDGLNGVILVAEWPPSADAIALDVAPGAAGGSQPDEDSIPLQAWVAAVEASDRFRAAARRRPRRIVFAPEETGD